MKPRERRETGQNDLFKARLDQIIDLGHPLVCLAQRIDWTFLEAVWGGLYGRPWQPAFAHAADGGAAHPKIQRKPLGRTALRGLG